MRASVTANRDYAIAKKSTTACTARFSSTLGGRSIPASTSPITRAPTRTGMRKDVIDLVRELKVPVVRYPGGNFVSGLQLGGRGSVRARIGRRGSTLRGTRPSPIRSACMEFAQWCQSAGTEMMLAINLGSRGLDQARNFVEYVNGPTGSAWGDLRKKHGRAGAVRRQALVSSATRWMGRGRSATRPLMNMGRPRQRGGEDAPRFRSLA